MILSPSLRFNLVTVVRELLLAVSLGAACLGVAAILGRGLSKLLGDLGSAVALALGFATTFMLFLGAITVLYSFYVDLTTPRTLYEISNRRVRHAFWTQVHRGSRITDPLYFEPADRSIALADITAVRVSQSPLERRLNYGRVTLSGGSDPQAELTMPGIVEPLRVKERLETIIHTYGSSKKAIATVSARSAEKEHRRRGGAIAGALAVFCAIVGVLSVVIYHGPYFSAATLAPGETREIQQSLDLVIFDDLGWTEADTGQMQVAVTAASDDLARVNDAISATAQVTSVNIVGRSPRILNIRYTVTVSLSPHAPSGSVQLFVRFTHPKIAAPRIRNEPVGRLKITVR
jgi:hypothetical protein